MSLQLDTMAKMIELGCQMIKRLELLFLSDCRTYKDQLSLCSKESSNRAWISQDLFVDFVSLCFRTSKFVSTFSESIKNLQVCICKKIA